MNSTKIKLNNGVLMPSLGLGVYKIPKIKTEKAVSLALKSGYRLIDTAAYYGNEKEVGISIKKSKIPRKEIFVTTKLHPLRIFGIRQAFNTSLEKLGLDYVDLYLVHWPFLRTRKIWKDLESLYAEKKIRAIGVSNFTVSDLKNLLKYSKIIPAINQVEFHPFFYQKDLLSYCNSKKIKLEAHTPLTHGKRINDLEIDNLAKKYNKSSSQIMLRWNIQHGLIAIPKSSQERHIKENIDIFDFNLSKSDMHTLDNISDNYKVSAMSKIVN